MKYAIVNFTKLTPTSLIASNRIATHLKTVIPESVMIDRKEACNPKRQYDYIILINGNFGFCDFREEIIALCRNNKRFIWAGNDYAIRIPSQLKKCMDDLTYWCAYDMDKDDGTMTSEYKYVNWNALTYQPLDHQPPKTFGGLMYYGAYRAGREKYFEEYLGEGVDYDVYISASSKPNAKKFFRLNPKAKFFEGRPPYLLETISAFKNTIYIEDEKTHQLYCSPANRFYEAVSSDVFLLFDHKCLPTFERAEIGITEYLVAGREEVEDKLKHRNELHQRQRKEFRDLLDCSFNFDSDLTMAMDGLTPTQSAKA